MTRERWATRIGLVLAMAGNAIGLGNFLRFPRLAAQYGGGAFMVPYLVALLLLGIPLMWLEWSMGRFGGRHGHSTTPGMFARLWRGPAAKYLGSLGVSLPLLFAVYYTYIESWTLGYTWFSASGAYVARVGVGRDTGSFDRQPASSRTVGAVSRDEVDDSSSAPRPGARSLAAGSRLRNAAVQAAAATTANPLAEAHTNRFLRDYQGVTPPGQRQFFTSIWPAVTFWLITVALNTWIVSHGIASGVERLAKIAMPLLFLFAVILVVRVLTYGTPDPARPENSVWAGLNYVWQPNFRALADFKVWLMAAGQIFFTLSIGTGTIQCYASYLRPDDDCALTGLTTAATNEFAEVVLGATIAIPIAVATFGLTATQSIAAQGSFDLGFVAMPIIFEELPAGRLFGTFWFGLLFFAGLTSSVALCQPPVAFLQDSFGLSRRAAALVCGATMLALGLPIVLLLKTGYMDQYDLWIGTFGLVLFALAEVLAFAWMFGGQNMWAELQHAADIRIPRVFYYIIRYLVPVYLVVLLAGWTWQSLDDAILLKGVPAEHVPYQWLARGTIAVVLLGVAVLVGVAFRKSRPTDPSGKSSP